MPIINPDSNFHTITGKSVVNRSDEQYIKYRKAWEEWPNSGIIGDFPLHLDIEPTNMCNLRCPFCATTHNKYKKGFMSRSIWKKILDEAGQHNLNSLKFTFRGEPLMHPDLPEMISYAKKVGVMDVYFNTNGLLLADGIIKKLIEAGLDRISISFEGYEKAVYDRYRVGSNFDTVIKNVQHIQLLREKAGSRSPLIRVQTVLIPELIGSEKKYAEFWSTIADEVAYLDMKDEAGNPDHRGIISDWACHMLWQRLTITWEGEILPCVHDIYEWMNLGKIPDSSIQDAWLSQKEQSFRYLHRGGNAHKIPACDRCPLRENEIDKLNRNP
jgi:radical SAM protein with 4Fe4S-binding SPASM domain